MCRVVRVVRVMRRACVVSCPTGIARDTVAHSMGLADVLGKFQDYLEGRFADLHLGHDCRSFRILTDGMWDVHIQLAIEAQRKGITLRTTHTTSARRRSRGPVLTTSVRALPCRACRVSCRV